MKNLATVFGTAILALTLAAPVSLAETTTPSASSAVENTQKFAAPFGAACTLEQIETVKACNKSTDQLDQKYPSAPVFPQFGI
ncbi:MAG: hypothetical protein AAFY99_01520 [Pseudomonadota bacterium]